MYITQVEVNKQNRQKYRDLSHLGSYHRWVERCFPKEFEDGLRSRKLWRVDRLKGKDYLMILSESKPVTDCLETYGVKGSVKVIDYNDFINTLTENHTYMFKVELNPVRRFDGKEVSHTTVEHQLKYLESRQDDLGFKMVEGTYGINERGVKKLSKKGQHTIDVTYAVYEGLLQITNLELFKETLIKGIGRKKSYGFGLMTVIPVE